MEILEPKKPIIKTYSRKLTQKASGQPKTTKLKTVIVIKREVLTTKKAVELLLSGTLKNKVCRYCLNITYPLTELDQFMQIGGKDALYKVTVRDIVASVHPFKVTDDPNFPNMICEKCLNEALRAYIFSQQCDQAERALKNCFDDVFDKLNKLDPLERQKKRGRQKLHPNHNTLFAEHKNVIDYAEPIRHLINSSAVSFTNEPQMSDLECKRCWQVLPNMESLVYHEKTHPKTMWYHCRLCGKSFAKRYQIKRHLRLHANGTNPNLQEKHSDFVCNQCGLTSDSYNVHLQHIEKHKFKMVLEHLVDRKMDKLCAVCFDNKGPLVDLDKMVCLHGGYPELTGDRSLYNILGATIPEANYKYQELPVAHKPRIMSITKKINKNSTNNDAFNDNRCSLSLPKIISMENKVYNESYTYIFSDAEYFDKDRTTISKERIFDGETELDKDTETDDAISNEESFETFDVLKPTTDKFDYPVASDDDLFTAKTPELVQNACNEMNIEFSDDESNNNIEKNYDKSGNDPLIEENTIINFAFSNPDVVDIENEHTEGVKNKTEQKKQIDNLCRYCWVFKKAMCKICMDIEESANRNTNTENTAAVKDLEANEMAGTKKSCRYCWLFENAEKCEYCHSTKEIESVFIKQPKKIELNDTSEQQDQIGIMEKEQQTGAQKRTLTEIESNEVTEIKSNDILHEDREKKRKSEAETTIPAKKTKWQCNICLTNNTNRETCICCDSRNMSEDTLKLNFSFKTSFLDFLKTATPKVEEKRDANETEKKIHTELQPIKVNAEIEPKSVTKIVTTVPKVVYFTAKSNINVAGSPTSITNTLINKQNQNEETMEVAEEFAPSTSFSASPMHSYPNPYSFAFSTSPMQFRPQMMLPTFQNAPFQFNIGAMPENKGRHQRKFRRFMNKL